MKGQEKPVRQLFNGQSHYCVPYYKIANKLRTINTVIIQQYSCHRLVLRIILNYCVYKLRSTVCMRSRSSAGLSVPEEAGVPAARRHVPGEMGGGGGGVGQGLGLL